MQAPAGIYRRCRAQFLDVVGRLKPDVTLAAAQNELKVLAQRFEKTFPGDNKGKRIGVHLYRDTLTGNVRPALLALLASVAVLLLIAFSLRFCRYPTDMPPHHSLSGETRIEVPATNRA